MPGLIEAGECRRITALIMFDAAVEYGLTPERPDGVPAGRAGPRRGRCCGGDGCLLLDLGCVVLAGRNTGTTGEPRRRRSSRAPQSSREGRPTSGRGTAALGGLPDDGDPYHGGPTGRRCTATEASRRGRRWPSGLTIALSREAGARGGSIAQGGVGQSSVGRSSIRTNSGIPRAGRAGVLEELPAAAGTGPNYGSTNCSGPAL